MTQVVELVLDIWLSGFSTSDRHAIKEIADLMFSFRESEFYAFSINAILGGVAFVLMRKGLDSKQNGFVLTLQVSANRCTIRTAAGEGITDFVSVSHFLPGRFSFSTDRPGVLQIPPICANDLNAWPTSKRVFDKVAKETIEILTLAKELEEEGQYFESHWDFHFRDTKFRLIIDGPGNEGYLEPDYEV